MQPKNRLPNLKKEPRRRREADGRGQLNRALQVYGSQHRRSRKKMGRPRLGACLPIAKQIRHLGEFLIDNGQSLDVKDLVRRFGRFRMKAQSLWVDQFKCIYRFNGPARYQELDDLALRHLVLDESNRVLIDLHNKIERVAS